MKVVLSGGTGYIGSEVLRQCLDHPSITSVLVLTRRDIPSLAGNPKANVIVLKDFTSYDEATINELRDADTAIWCLGTLTGDEKVDIEYPLAFINAIRGSTRSFPFRYVQLSGALTEPPPKEGQKERSLWLYANGRRVRGAMEVKILEAASHDLEVYLLRPGGVRRKDGVAAFIQKCVLGESLTIAIDELGATMVDLAVRGNEQKVFQNQEIIRYGRRLLDQQ